VSPSSQGRCKFASLTVYHEKNFVCAPVTVTVTAPPQPCPSGPADATSSRRARAILQSMAKAGPSCSSVTGTVTVTVTWRADNRYNGPSTHNTIEGTCTESLQFLGNDRVSYSEDFSWHQYLAQTDRAGGRRQVQTSETAENSGTMAYPVELSVSGGDYSLNPHPGQRRTSAYTSRRPTQLQAPTRRP
jgi:hypothetical protein